MEYASDGQSWMKKNTAIRRGGSENRETEKKSGRRHRNCPN